MRAQPPSLKETPKAETLDKKRVMKRERGKAEGRGMIAILVCMQCERVCDDQVDLKTGIEMSLDCHAQPRSIVVVVIVVEEVLEKWFNSDL